MIARVTFGGRPIHPLADTSQAFADILCVEVEELSWQPSAEMLAKWCSTFLPFEEQWIFIETYQLYLPGRHDKLSEREVAKLVGKSCKMVAKEISQARLRLYSRAIFTYSEKQDRLLSLSG